MYPQSDVSLAMIDIVALKGFVDLWVHLSFAMFAIFDLKGWEHHILSMKGCHAIQPFYFNDNFRRYSLWVYSFTRGGCCECYFFTQYGLAE